MSTYKTRRRILGADGEYHIIHEETSSDQVLHTDGTTVDNHIDDTDIHTTAEEKEKLAGIEDGANKYTLPVASSSAIGGVKSGTDITVDSEGNVSVNDDSHNHVISNVDGLQGALDDKAAATHASQHSSSGSDPITPADIGAAAASHGTHVTFSTTAPVVAGTASVGSATTVPRSDHVHPAQTTVSGNAGSATKLATARAIDGVSFDGTAAIVHYGTCSTAAATAAKTVACTSFTLVTGSRIIVKFTVTNTAASPTLNVNSTGAKAIYYRGAAITAGYLAANRVYEFVYDGSYYQLVGDIDTDTNTVYTHPNSGVTAGTYRSVTVNAAGHVTAGSNPTTTVAQGGTGATTLTSGTALIGNGTSAITTRTIRNNTATSGAVTADTALITSNTLRYAINRTTSVAAADTNYTTYMARGQSLNSAETTPTVNGTIAWTYE